MKCWTVAVELLSKALSKASSQACDVTLFSHGCSLRRFLWRPRHFKDNTHCSHSRASTPFFLHYIVFCTHSRYLSYSLSLNKPFLRFPVLLLIWVSRRTTYSTRILRLDTSYIVCGHLLQRQGRPCSLNKFNSVGLFANAELLPTLLKYVISDGEANQRGRVWLLSQLNLLRSTFNLSGQNVLVERSDPMDAYVMLSTNINLQSPI